KTPCTLATLYDPGKFSTIITFIDCFLLSAARLKASTLTLYFYEAQSLQVSLAALVLSCLRLNLISRFRLQGWILTAG
ncbi:MAG: hypothetical protein PUH25_03885, partial [Spirochaetales bacterium]|nr:hypothetical protein [Spirochaetales bacterium]